MATIRINGHKLYRDLWVHIGQESYEMEGSFGFPAKALSDSQLKILYALAWGNGIDVADDGAITPVIDKDIDYIRTQFKDEEDT